MEVVAGSNSWTEKWILGEPLRPFMLYPYPYHDHYITDALIY
jgi:hypothetical protein